MYSKFCKQIPQWWIHMVCRRGWRGCNRPERKKGLWCCSSMWSKVNRERKVSSQASFLAKSSRIWCFRLVPGAHSKHIYHIPSSFPLLSLHVFTPISSHSIFSRYVLLLFILFFIPGVMMIIAYGLISRELYRGMQFEMGQNTENAGELQQKFKP